MPLYSMFTTSRAESSAAVMGFSVTGGFIQAIFTGGTFSSGEIFFLPHPALITPTLKTTRIRYISFLLIAATPVKIRGTNCNM